MPLYTDHCTHIPYQTHRPHVPQEALVARQVIVPINLQHELQVQVLPVPSVVDLVRIDPEPWLVIWGGEEIRSPALRAQAEGAETEQEKCPCGGGTCTWVPNIMGDDVPPLHRCCDPTHQEPSLRQVLPESGQSWGSRYTRGGAGQGMGRLGVGHRTVCVTRGEPVSRIHMSEWRRCQGPPGSGLWG